MAAGDIYQVVGGIKGRSGVALLGGASDDGVQIDSFMAARVAANDTTGTFSIWFNVADIAGDYAIIGGGDESAVQYFYISMTAGQIHAKAALVGPDVCWDLVSTDAVIRPHEWHLVTFVQDAVKPVIYLDGVRLTLTETDITEPTYWFDTFALIDGGHIGCADSIAGGAALTLELKGAVGETKYWNAALTADEVLENYKEGGTTTNLIAKWDMHDDYVDSVGGEDGTAVGDVILTDNYSEFTSKLRNLAVPLVADDISISVENDTGYAIVVKAA